MIDLDNIRENLIFEFDSKEIEDHINICIEGFKKEYEIMKICSNDNSVKCYEYFYNKDNFVIIMELCDKNLSQLLKDKYLNENEGFNIEEIYEIMKQLNKGLKIMIKNNIIHRDLKLENVLVKYKNKENREYIVKLSDYGNSKRLESTITSKNYGNSFVGTLHYMAPEILKGEKYNYKCDIWSIGVILYRLKYGKSPFIGNTENAIINSINNFKKELIKTGNEEFDDLLRKLLEKDVIKRINWNEYFNHPFFKEKKEKKNIINLIYEKKSGIFGNNIFGKKFVENNKNNIELIINGIKSKLASEYELNEGINNIEMIIKNKIKNLEYMFFMCVSLKDIEGLKNLDVKDINNFSFIFSECLSLSDIEPLENWNVSNGTIFQDMFSGCSSLTNLKPLQNWNVSNGNNFSGMFYWCKYLSDLKSLENWNVSNGNNFKEMFNGCSSLSDIKSLQNWNVSNGNDFSYMFYGCSSLSNIKSLQNWNVSKGNDFSYMFYGCSSLSDIKSLQNWNISNGNNFKEMFNGCSSLSDIKSLQNWNVSKGNDFSYMFHGCYSLSNIIPLQNWNVSTGINFAGIFYDCELLSDIKSLQNWNVSNGNNFSGMFAKCSSLSDIQSLQNWNVSNGNNFSGMFGGC